MFKLRSVSWEGARLTETRKGQKWSARFQLPKQSFIWKWQAAEPGFGVRPGLRDFAESQTQG